MSDAKLFLKSIGVKVKNFENFAPAFIHSSYGNLNKLENYERREFLGDSILDFLAAEALLNKYPLENEGYLSKQRAAMISEDALLIYAKKINLEKYIKTRVSPIPKSIIADCMEALIGSIYLDSGIAECKKFFEKHIWTVFLKEIDIVDYKTILQEYYQGFSNKLISYKLISESGPSNDKTFVSGVYYEKDILLATGTGRSKALSEKAAAKKALAKLQTKESTDAWKTIFRLFTGFFEVSSRLPKKIKLASKRIQFRGTIACWKKEKAHCFVVCQKNRVRKISCWKHFMFTAH